MRIPPRQNLQLPKTNSPLLMAKKQKGKGRKLRTQLRKGYQKRKRKGDFTREYEQHAFEEQDLAYGERVSGKGELTRHRTIIGESNETEQDGFQVQLDVELKDALAGLVISVHGRTCQIQDERGNNYNCAVRGLLKTLNTDQRHVIAAGDRVLFRHEGTEGMILRVEPRKGIISRGSRGKQHVIVANVDQLLIVASVLQPELKPNLIDRLIITAEKGNIRPIICFNKVDLIDPAELQSIAGIYGQLGYTTILCSCETGQGIELLKTIMCGRKNVITGQSGVGKSSLLNEVDPTLNLKVNDVSLDNEKGKHTTTAARLIPLAGGGYVVDTPGVRQFQLWDVIETEVEGFFRDIRPFVHQCRFHDCSHVHENHCAVKHAVADGLIDIRRYDSYCQIRESN